MAGDNIVETVTLSRCALIF